MVVWCMGENDLNGMEKRRFEADLEEESSLDLNLADWMIETKGVVSTKDSRVMLKEIQWRKKLSTINL